MTFFEYVIVQHERILRAFAEHMKISFEALALAILIGVPVGILMSANRKLSKVAMTVINGVQAVPSLALLGLLIPLVGVSEKTAIILVVLYALLPIVKNTFVGLINISPDMIEVASGLGMTKAQTLFNVQIPMAMPVTMAGVRISAVNTVGLVTIASYVGGKGLGFLVYSGINTVNMNMVLSGAVPAALLALAMDFLVSRIERIVVPMGIQTDRKQL